MRATRRREEVAEVAGPKRADLIRLEHLAVAHDEHEAGPVRQARAREDSTALDDMKTDEIGRASWRERVYSEV